MFLVRHPGTTKICGEALANDAIVFFLYPETANVRLEDMDQLFGDATTAMPTPAQHAEVESLMSARSPVPSLDIRRTPGHFSADSAIPGLDINPPQEQDSKAPLEEQTPKREGLGGWISRMANRGKKDFKGSDGESRSYRRLNDDED